jgi:hypothetical protein
VTISRSIPTGGTIVPEYEYRTEMLTSMVGREKLRLDELDETLCDHGDEGWELVSLILDADVRGGRNGHLLVFKRAK